MKAFSPAGMATKGLFGYLRDRTTFAAGPGAKSFGNPDGATSGGGAYVNGGASPDGPSQGGNVPNGGGGGGFAFSWSQQASSGGRLTPNSAAHGIVAAVDQTLPAINVSLDGGVTFTPAAGIAGGTPQYLGAGNTAVWVASADVSNYFRSNDDAATWSGPFTLPAGLGVQPMGDVASDGAGHFVMLTSTIGGPTAANYVVSSDNGASWSLPNNYSNNGWSSVIWDGSQFVATALQATTGLNVVAVSGDFGSTWVETVIAAGNNPSFSNALSFDTVTGRYLLGADSASHSPVVRTATTPAGLALAANVNTGLTAGQGLSYAIAAAGVFFAFDFSGGVARSLDGGATWVQGALNMPFGARAFCACHDAVHAKFIACATFDGVTIYP